VARAAISIGRRRRHIPVLFPGYHIQKPSFSGFVTTQDRSLLKFLPVFNKA